MVVGGVHSISSKWVINKGYPFRVTSPDKILDLIKPEGEIDLKELGLNERQIEALKLIVNERKKLTNMQYRDMFNVSKPTATRDLTQLVKENRIREVGKGRSIGYIGVSE